MAAEGQMWTVVCTSLGAIIGTSLGATIGLAGVWLKMRFDAKSKKDVYAQEVFKRQFVAYTGTYRAVLAVHRSMYHVAFMYPLIRSPEKEHEDFVKSTRGSLGKHASRFSGAFDKFQPVLPTSLVMLLQKYKVFVANLLALGLTDSVNTREKLDALWTECEETYNAILNHIRLSLGVDHLSSEVTKMVTPDGEWNFIKAVNSLR